jgi:tetratricopeptide (TPR) repeat protein
VAFSRILAAAVLAAAAFTRPSPVAGAPVAGAPGSFEEGERLFRENKPAEAAFLLEKAVLESGVDERSWIYLGLSYQQMGKLEEAAGVLRKGLATALRFKPIMYFDLGNVFLLQGKNAFAADMFSEAISLDSSFAPAFLNRANARLNTRDYEGARADYSRYLDLDPASSQRDSIEEILRRLGASIDEARRVMEEEEAKRAAEEAARRALLEQVAASLKAAADETTSLSAGSGEVQGYEDELKLDE